MSDPDPSLDAAYALETPDDNRALYRDWAQSYDQDFAAAHDYHLPQQVAYALPDLGRGPVLDLGAGTGLLGRVIKSRLPETIIHGLDISPEMLAQASAKGDYEATFVADLTKPIGLDVSPYRAFVSAGTFTHGHLGPEILPGLIQPASSGACFILSINKAHFEKRGFSAVLMDLKGEIEMQSLNQVSIYGPSAPEGHQNDMALLAVFLKR